MFKRWLALLLIVASFAAANYKIIPPEQAFELNFIQKDNHINFKIDMKDGVYLLDDKISFDIESPKKFDFTDMINAPEPEIYKDQKVHFNSYVVSIAEDFLRTQKISGKTTIKVSYQGCAAGGVICYPPMSRIYEIEIEKGFTSEQNMVADMLQNRNLFFALASFFGFGLLLSLTPCTFPMVPIISSIIASYSRNEMSAKKGFLLSFVYVFFMSIAYAIAGVIAGMFGANIQVYLQNPWVVCLFSVIFVILAMSMFDFLNFGLSSTLQSKIFNAGKDKKGLVGVAIIGFLSALIVGPCVAAPLMGTLIYIGQSGDMLFGGLALFVMSMAMGIPLLLIGLSAGKFLPKPGLWMNAIQKFFGFVMLGVAVWMLSRIIPVNITLMLYALLLIAFGLYLFLFNFLGNIWQKILKIMAVIIVAYGIVLLLGGIKGGSFLLKPLENFSKSGVEKLPIDFMLIKNLTDLEAVVAKSQRPIMLEFTASWCAICTEFEDKTLSQKSVQKRLENFTVLKADVTKNSEDDKEIMRRFGLYGPPAIVFFKNGLELEELQIVGFKNAEEFLKHLDLAEK